MGNARRRWRRLAIPALAVVVLSAFGARGAGPPVGPFSYGFGAPVLRIVPGRDGTVALAGVTIRTDLPAALPAPPPHPAAYDDGWQFVSVLEPDGTPRWTAFVGVYEPHGSFALAVAPDGSIWTASNGEIVASNAFQRSSAGWFDGVLAKFSAEGVLLAATHLGGSRDDLVDDLAVLPDGDVVVSGTTDSDDFPGAPVTGGTGDRRNDAFVTRIRGDASGIVWSRRVSDSAADAVGIAADPADGSILVGIAGRRGAGGRTAVRPLRAPHPTPRPRRSQSAPTLVKRLAPDGTELAAARIDFVGVHGPVPVAVGPDGGVYVGGSLGTAKLTRDLDRVTEAWCRRTAPGGDGWTSRICPLADGRVVVEQTREWFCGYLRPAVALLRPGSRRIERLGEPHHGILPADVSTDDSGSVLIAGERYGIATFNAPATASGDDSRVARVPVDGVRPPSGLRAVATSPTTADVSWILDGAPVERFELMSSYTDPVVLLASPPAGASSVRLTGLSGGAHYDLRLFAVFAGGVRSSVHATLRTPPEGPSNVVATSGPDGTVTVTWDQPNEGLARYEVDRRVGDGPWIARPWSYRTPGVLIDHVPAVDPDVVYRVRANVDREQLHEKTPYATSPPIRLAPTLAVVQTLGRLHRATPAQTVLDLEASFARADTAGPVAFDPSRDAFAAKVGDLADPDAFGMDAGDPGWSVAGPVVRWQADRTLSRWDDGSWMEIDLARATFRCHLVSAAAALRTTTRSIVLEISLGGLVGAEARVWRGRTGAWPSLVLR